MFTSPIFQEGTEQNGVGGYVWIALIIFFLMVFLGWLVASKGWLNKGGEPGNVDHDHEPHPNENDQSESANSLDSANANESVRAGSIALKDDLTKLEGIGPKVAKVLAGIKITTFDGLAKAEYTKVKSALDEAGYQYMDPAGWIDQAVLAAKGDLEGLKKLQDSLKGGRKVN